MYRPFKKNGLTFLSLLAFDIRGGLNAFCSAAIWRILSASVRLKSPCCRRRAREARGERRRRAKEGRETLAVLSPGSCDWLDEFPTTHLLHTYWYS